MDEIARKTADFVVGGDLYGVSVAELKGRIGILKDEITRIEAELKKKQSDLNAAQSLFGSPK